MNEKSTPSEVIMSPPPFLSGRHRKSISGDLIGSWGHTLLYSDQITIKTPNPKCRLDWCLIEFIDWRYSQSRYFRPLLRTSAPLTSHWFTTHPPPFPVWISKGVCIYTVCNIGRDRDVWRSYTGVIHCVFDQILNLKNCFTTPNKNLGGEGASDR